MNDLTQRRRSFGGAVVAGILLTTTIGEAKTLAPSLDPTSEAALFRALGGAGFADPAKYSVENALMAVLRFQPATRRYHYRQPDPHLPDVDSRASPGETGCARVELEARSKSGPRRRVAIRGTYCLTNPSRGIWSSRALSVR